MCAIAGWLLADGADLQRAHAEQLGRSLDHRGPDDSGVIVDADRGLALVHQRLSIVDLSDAGHQPMVHPQSDNVLIYNGEIYNHRALRDELRMLGTTFRSQCDTEVLLHALQHWGMDALAKIHGMYAFAYWDSAARTLHLVRDPMGIKPLYYWSDPMRGGVVFASEAKAFLDFPGFEAHIDEQSLQQYLEFGYTFDKDRTMFAGLRKLPPGARLSIRAGQNGDEVPRYISETIFHYAPDLTPRPLRDYDAVQDELHHTLDSVVAEHRIADVPIALLLSGGLDSSLLAAYAARHGTLHTLTFSFSGSTVDERPHAREVSAFLNTDHEEIVLSSRDFLEELDDSVHCFDDLFADWGLFSTHLLYRQCRQRGFKAVIVGEGSDELFAGYMSVFASGLNRSSWPPMDWRLFQLYRRYIGSRYGRSFLAFRAQMRQFLHATDGDLFAAIRLFETRCQLPNNYVMKVDKASMATGVEARVPYLDTRVSSIAWTLPREMLIRQRTGKQVLRDMASRFKLLPEPIIQREKFGAGIAASWMDDDRDFRAHAESLILGDSGWVDRLGLRPAMSAYFHDGRAGFAFPHHISIFRNLAWRLLMLNLWSQQMGVSP
ncbi:MAG: asparagine synthase (glutamine-hydrolyzing) [Gammaproteobacteria bacterium]|jgi:asparagine synthase (glutamine-hydrolysing)